MDPQHALALGLATDLWEDAGPEAATAAKADLSRVGETSGCTAYATAVS